MFSMSKEDFILAFNYNDLGYPLSKYLRKALLQYVLHYLSRCEEHMTTVAKGVDIEGHRVRRQVEYPLLQPSDFVGVS